MGIGLHDPALAALGRIYGSDARSAITGAAVLGLFEAASASVLFTILYGAVGGILTIARGTVPLAIFGAENYGYRLGVRGAQPA